MQTQIPLPNDEQLAPDVRKTLNSVPPANIFRMMANAPTSLKPFIALATSILAQSEFDMCKRELVILRIAHVTQSHYEWVQHVRIAQIVGVTDEEINKIAVNGPVQGVDEEMQLLYRVAEEISLNVRLSDDALTAILQRYGQRQATELILCCSYFNMVSRFLESTRVPLEDAAVI
ncbi:MAG: carboxymuconolactone decarboxylase family protein [Gammaproteobacteria bacterium]|nr:carboxymuconolactone decarboxylase family protein [Gammaproteobacteria bacterium]